MLAYKDKLKQMQMADLKAKILMIQQSNVILISWT